MAIDLEALRRKVAQLKGEDRKGSGNRFKPALADTENEKTFEVRLLPLTKGDVSTPCREIWFYPWDIVNGAVPTLKQQGKPDPIEELIQLLRKDYDNNKETLKKLYPKMSAFGHVIVRGQEDKGPQEWKLTKLQFERILNIMLDDDYGDVTDPLEGRDLKVKISVEQGKFFNGKRSTKLEIDPKGKTSALHSDKELVKKWLASIPDPMDAQEFKTYDEVKALVDKWLAAPVAGATTTTEETRGGKAQESTSPVEKAQTKQTRQKTTTVATEKVEDIDAAFADLENDLG
jgi:hypothetical protein